MMNFMKLGYTGAELREEFIRVWKLPDYKTNRAWYDDQYNNQKDKVAVIHIATSLDAYPKLKAVVASFYPLELFSHIQLFVAQPRHVGVWHLDGVDRKASINIPIYNCEVGAIEWTDAVFDKATRFKSEFTTHMAVTAPDANVSDRGVLTEIALVRANTWHRINNSENANHRVVLALRFKDNPEFETLQAALQKVM